MRIFIILVILFFGVFSFNTQAETFDEAVQALNSNSFSTKETAVKALAELNDPRSLPIFEHMLEGELFYVKKTKAVVYVEETEEGYRATDVLTEEDLGEFGKRKVKKISVNNSLRKLLRGVIAEMQLSNPDVEARLLAATDIIKTASEDNLPLIEKALAKETDDRVRNKLFLAKGLILSGSTDEAARLEAVELFKGELSADVMAILARMSLPDEAGNFSEPSKEVRAAAAKVYKNNESSISFYKFVENLFFGVSLGSVLLLAAVGLAITFGVMGVINMAHGEMMMLGAYTTYVIQQALPQYLEISLIIAVPAAFLVAGFVGVLIERFVIRYLYGRPLETLLATFGISLILQQAVRTIFSPLNKSVASPSWMSGFWEVNGALSLTYNRLYIIIFSIVVLLLLTLLLKKTLFGLQMRAVTQNRSMARSMGIRSSWVDALTFGLGSGIAGIAGVALSQLTNVGPNLGQAYIVDSFMVVVFGGVGNLFGTFFAAMSLGIANKFMEPVAGAVLAKILVLVFIILFIQKYPRGLFAVKGRFVED